MRRLFGGCCRGTGALLSVEESGEDEGGEGGSQGLWHLCLMIMTHEGVTKALYEGESLSSHVR